MCVGALLACAAVPDSADLFEVAVLQWASRLGGLRDGICCLVADCCMSCRDIDLSPWAVMPLDRLMAARMVVRVAVTHLDDRPCCVKVCFCQEICCVLVCSGFVLLRLGLY